jgi:hypothetical protein
MVRVPSQDPGMISEFLFEFLQYFIFITITDLSIGGVLTKLTPTSSSFECFAEYSYEDTGSHD